MHGPSERHIPLTLLMCGYSTWLAADCDVQWRNQQTKHNQNISWVNSALHPLCCGSIQMSVSSFPVL